LNSPISIEKDVALLHRPLQQSKAMRKPKPKRNSHNRLSLSVSTTQADLTEHPPENPQSQTIALC
jgi:hypothetical protein